MNELDVTSGGAVVVGGGWSGIAAAWNLIQRGHRVTLVGREMTLGGRSAVQWAGGRALTLGGKNIGGRYRHFRAFATAMGVTAFQPFGINTSRVERGRLRTIDGNSRLRSVVGLLRRAHPADVLRAARMISWVMADERNRFVTGPAFQDLARRLGDPSLESYFGREFLATIVRPMTVRMNGAEPGEMHLSTFGANLGMLLDHYDQLTEGMAPLLSAFEKRVNLQLGRTAEELIVRNGRVCGIVTRDSSGRRRSHLSDVVVVGVPARDAGPLVQPHAEQLHKELMAIRYFPAGVAVVEYDGPVFPPTTRSLVFGAEEPVSNAGAYGIGDLHLVRYTFSGRKARPHLAGDPDFELLVKMGEKRLEPYFPIAGRRAIRVATRHWRHAYCGYSERHADRLERIVTLCRKLPGLVLTGDYFQGTSIEACFRAAIEQTSQVAPAPNG